MSPSCDRLSPSGEVHVKTCSPVFFCPHSYRWLVVVSWLSSDRRSRLPHDWAWRVRQVKARDHGRCQATVHVRKCDGAGTEVDHVIAGDDHRFENLQLLSAECHKAKTARENAARRKQMARLRYRPRESHPGAL